MEPKSDVLLNDYNTWLGRQIFHDAEFKGRVTFSGGTPVFDVRGFGAKGDDVTDDTAAINKAAAALALTESKGIKGSRLYFPPGTYKITDDILITSSCIIEGDDVDSIVKQYTNAKTAFTVSASSVYIRDIKLTGNGSDTYSAGSRAIYAYGADASHYISGITCHNVTINAWRDTGIYLSFVEQFLVDGCNVQDVSGHGILCMSCLEGNIVNNHVEDITCRLTSSNGYGIMLSKVVGGTATYPATKNVFVGGNLVRGIINPTDGIKWEGIDTHAGQDIQIIGNRIFRAGYGIVVTIASDGVATYFPAENVTVAFNTIDSEANDGLAKSGIEFASTATTAIQTGSIIGNLIKGHGDVTSSPANEGTAGAIVAYRTRNLVIEGNRILNPSSCGIDLVRDNSNFTCVGNSIDDPWGLTTQQNACWGIYSGTLGGNDGVISGNVISRDSMTVVNGVYLDTATKGYGITVADGTGSVVHMGHNWVEAAIPLSDTTHRCTVTDAESYATSAALSSGATYTFTNLIPAGSLVWGVTIRVTTLVTGATSISIGDGTDVDRWGNTIGVALNTTTDITDFTTQSPTYYTADTSVVLTANGSDFTAGVVKAIVHYMKLRIPVA